MSVRNKEEIFDEEIGPLVDQIVDLCTKYQIASVMSFCIPTPQAPTLICGSATVDETGYNPTVHVRMMRAGGMPVGADEIKAAEAHHNELKARERNEPH